MSFRDEALIFVVNNGQASWNRTAECLWSTGTHIGGKANLANQYGGESRLEKFFIHMLGVQQLNIDMVYDELLGITSQNATVNRVKDLLWAFNSMLETTEAGSFVRQPLQLLERPILPVRYSDGSVYLQNSGVQFAITDRAQLEELFGSRINLLDFDLAEVRALKPALVWAGLEDRYLSRLVQETTSLVDSSAKYAVSEPRYDIRMKAHGVLRY